MSKKRPRTKTKMPAPSPSTHDVQINMGNMQLEDFKLYSLTSLKGFLALRNRSLEGTFEELASRAFTAWEENIPVDPDNEHAYRKALVEYKGKLLIDNKVLPDPLGVTEGWLDEGQGMDKWPSLYFHDMASYLRMKTPHELCHRLINEYKEGKAYRSFVAGWVREVMYHPISKESKVCCMWCRVCPSFSVHNKDYQAWIFVMKDQHGVPGGEIVNSYCTCTAGLLGCCNHVTGLLFRIEAAVRTGMTKPSCTSKKCTWNLPNQKMDLLRQPTLASSVKWEKGHYMNQDNTHKDDSMRRDLFSPMSKRQENQLARKEDIRKQLADLLRPVAPDSCFIQLMDLKRASTTKEDSPSLMDAAVECQSELADLD